MRRAANFDTVARIYRWAEYLTLGLLLQRTRTYFLPQLTDRRCALVLGDGDGRFLEKLLAQNATLHATAVDSSEQMLKLLRTRCGTARVETIHADALTITPPPGTDLIVTHFFLDCFTQSEVGTLARKLAQPGVFWLLSDFRVTGPLSHVYIRSLYFAFRLLTGLRITHLPNPATALTAAGLHRIGSHQSLGGLLYTELWQLSSSLDSSSL